MPASSKSAASNEKVFLAQGHYTWWGTISPPAVNENRILKGACQEIDRTKNFSDDQKQMLTTVFQKRFEQAIGLVEAGRVRKYQFTPSRRTVWVVTGRGRDYQVLPESLFCTCDDYYFRVMEHKKQLCYHIIAQQLSVAMSKHNAIEMTDSRYPEITSKLTTIASHE